MDVSFTVAQWLVYNKELFSNVSMVALSELAVNGRSKEDAVEVILEELETTISHCHPEITRIEIKEALREQEVKTILDTYYLRGLVYEH